MFGIINENIASQNNRYGSFHVRGRNNYCGILLTCVYSERAKLPNVPKYRDGRMNIMIIPPQRLESIKATRNPLPQMSLL